MRHHLSSISLALLTLAAVAGCSSRPDPQRYTLSAQANGKAEVPVAGYVVVDGVQQPLPSATTPIEGAWTGRSFGAELTTPDVEGLAISLEVNDQDAKGEPIRLIANDSGPDGARVRIVETRTANTRGIQLQRLTPTGRIKPPPADAPGTQPLIKKPPTE
jgi:hypothetical protein